MEFYTSGELFACIVENTENGVQITEKQIAGIFKQMKSAIYKNGIVHRDLKPENLLYLNKDENSPIKVIDFGISKRFDSKHFMNEKVGTACMCQKTAPPRFPRKFAGSYKMIFFLSGRNLQIFRGNEGALFFESTGTAYYISPEVLQGKYD